MTAKPDFLATVLGASRARAASSRRERPEAALRAEAARMRPANSLREALAAPGRRFVAEVKRASPSKGPIAVHLDAAKQTAAYVEGGAAAISVLTEPDHFAGSLADLRAVRAAAAGLPVLRKDFLVDPYQAWESRVHGADAALLIAAALPGDALREMASALAEAGLEALVEVHDEAELARALEAGAPVIGVNARDLRTLVVDQATCLRLVGEIPFGVVAVAESGIRELADVERLERAGYRAFLVGEALARSEDPRGTLVRWIGSAA